MLSSTQQFIDILEAKGTKYTVDEPTSNGKDVLTVSYGGENMSTIRCRFFFDTDCQSVAIRVFDIVKIPESKLEAMYPVVNAVNNKFRFAKFCIDTKDSTIQAEMDASFRANDVGEICRELLSRCVNICDEAYPDLMKALWT